jgi:hypothetical protein
VNYIFEGTISVPTMHTREQSNGSINLGGMEVGASGNIKILLALMSAQLSMPQTVWSPQDSVVNVSGKSVHFPSAA